MSVGVSNKVNSNIAAPLEFALLTPTYGLVFAIIERVSITQPRKHQLT